MNVRKNCPRVCQLNFVLALALWMAGMPTSQAQITTLATFNNTNGAYPFGNLTLSGNTLYGTTESGGSTGGGTVFSVPLSGGAITTVVSFNGANGKAPTGSLTLSSDGTTLYGTTEAVGGNSWGTVFSIPVPAPEPTSTTLMLTGLVAVTLRRRRAAGY